MKLNPDCIRDILLTVEELTDFNHYLEYRINSDVFPKLSKYTHEEIIYHIRQCDKSFLILKVNYYDAGDCITIQDLSPKGHEFLANIRSDNIWNNTKAISKKIGSCSLEALTNIASTVVTQLINQVLFN